MPFRRVRTPSRAATLPAALVSLAALAVQPGPATTQERPFTTPRPWTLAPGAVRVETGARLAFKSEIPLSGLTGDLLELRATAGVGIAAGVEGRIEGAGWQRMEVESRDPSAPFADKLDVDDSSTGDVTDVTLAARLRLAGADEPLTAALQLGVRLPNAGNESGLGRDVTDALASLLAGCRSGPLRVAAEAGFAILGSPTRRASQNDQGRLGLLVEVEPRAERLAVGAEVRRSFGDEGPGNELETELALGGRVRLAGLWVDLAYRRVWLGGHGADAAEVGLSHTF